MPLYEVTQGFLLPGEDNSRGPTFKGGQVVSSNDPRLKGHIKNLTKVGALKPVDEEEIVEKATAAPGERRTELRESIVEVGEE